MLLSHRRGVTVKAITLHEPWASLIIDGHKTVETRSWAPPVNLIGHRIAIHAGKRKPRASEWPEEMRERIDAHYGLYPWRSGKILGTAVLAAAGQVTYIDHDADPPLAYAVYPSPQRSVAVDPFGDFSRGALPLVP